MEKPLDCPKGPKEGSTKGTKTKKGSPSSSLEHPLYSSPSDFRDTPSETPSNKKENPQAFLLKGSPFENGGYLLSHFYAVPSAWLGLTSLFGMGRGGTPTL